MDSLLSAQIPVIPFKSQDRTDRRSYADRSRPNPSQCESVVGCSDADLVASIREREAAMRQALVDQLTLIAEADRRGVPGTAGARSTQVWLRELLNLAEEEAKTRVVTATKTTTQADSADDTAPELPATATALRFGEISLAHARAIIDGIAKLPSSCGPEQRRQVDALLCSEAHALSPRQLRIAAERIRYHLDQDGALREEQHQIASRELHFGLGHAGMTVLNGRLDRETGAKLRAAIEPLAAPRPDQVDDPGNGAEAGHDPRSPGKRNADALGILLDRALAGNTLPRTSGQRPHPTVTISHDDLTQRIDRIDRDEPSQGGTLETAGQPITAAQARRIGCDAEILPIVLGGDSQPLDVGRAYRTAPPHLRAALPIRNGQCAFPRCDRPPGTSEAHHVRHWADGGHTSLDNMIMLCAHHHRVVHSQIWHITLATGRPMFTPPGWIDPTRTPRPGNRPAHHQPLARTG